MSQPSVDDKARRFVAMPQKTHSLTAITNTLFCSVLLFWAVGVDDTKNESVKER
jgi:hypothetical protein